MPHGRSATGDAVADREFEMTDGDFRRIRAIVKNRAGIELGDGKRALVYGRLARRLRELGLARFSDYLALVEGEEGEVVGDVDEADRFLNAITTNVTEFFRENHHFDFLVRTGLPEIYQRHRSDKRVRIWSAGCSTGEEPYSIAMVLRENPPPTPGWDVRVLATDLDSDVLATAGAGVYARERVRNVSGPRLDRWFEGEGAADVRVRAAVRDLITFKRLNLIEPFPMRGPFDVIFCRNVVIYFDEATKLDLVRRFHGLLAEDGVLVLGHSESLVSAGLSFRPVGRTIYRRTANALDAA